MDCLSHFSYTKPRIFASSLPNNSTPDTSPNPPRNNKIIIPKTSATRVIKPMQQKPKPSVADIERAIGAGVFKDRDTSNRNPEKKKTLFDSILSNSIGKSEGSVERKLRETGEWMLDRTERTSNSIGKRILVAIFVWVLPIWVFSFLVASGILKLPFSTPFLDDLIM